MVLYATMEVCTLFLSFLFDSKELGKHLNTHTYFTGMDSNARSKAQSKVSLSDLTLLSKCSLYNSDVPIFLSFRSL